MAKKSLSLECENLISDCKRDLHNIGDIVKKVRKTSDEVPYLTRYALIKSHGTIEQCYKNTIAEFCEPGASNQMIGFFERNFRNKAARLKYDDIIKDLKNFDKNWGDNFKNEMKKFVKNRNRIITSISSLVDARNQFAHGLNPQITLKDIKKYFIDAEKIIRCLGKSVK